jgi:hypothetical protein
LAFACGFDESCWKSITWCIMVHAWFVQLDCLPLRMS